MPPLKGRTAAASAEASRRTRVSIALVTARRLVLTRRHSACCRRADARSGRTLPGPRLRRPASAGGARRLPCAISMRAMGHGMVGGRGMAIGAVAMPCEVIAMVRGVVIERLPCDYPLP